jgi:hypothetical protein
VTAIPLAGQMAMGCGSLVSEAAGPLTFAAVRSLGMLVATPLSPFACKPKRPAAVLNWPTRIISLGQIAREIGPSVQDRQIGRERIAMGIKLLDVLYVRQGVDLGLATGELARACSVDNRPAQNRRILTTGYRVTTAICSTRPRISF